MGPPELGIILVIVLVIFGGSQLPKLARNLGKAQKEFKDGLSVGEQEAAAEKRRADAVTDATVRDATVRDATVRDATTHDDRRSPD